MGLKRTIGVLGADSADLCIYLASLLKNLDYTLLLVDDSGKRNLMHCIPQPKEALTVINYQGVDYEEMVFKDELCQRDYDFILVHMSEFPSKQELAPFEELFLVCGCERIELERCQSFIQQALVPVNVVLRGICGEKITGKYWFQMLERQNPFVMERFCIRLDEMDESYRIEMQYDYFKQFEQLSGGYQKVLIRIGLLLTGKKRNAVVRALAKAKRGGGL